GVETPHIKSLAEEGVIFTRAFSNAAVCSAARSTLITSAYGPRMASHYHRAEGKVTLTGQQEMFPAYLRKAGYYTTNNAKEDYNFHKSDEVWDDSSNKATWRNRKEGQPFFHVFNIETTHEGRLHFSKKEMDSVNTVNDPNTVFVQPNHPQTDLFSYTNAFYRDRISEMDVLVGEVIAQLKDDQLLENTIIFYYGDHGGVLPGSKGYLNENGLHVPLVIYVPEKYQELSVFKPGSSTDTFVSFVDFGATVLSIAGVEVPGWMDGKPFMGKNVSLKSIENRDETFGYADRFDEKYDMVRSYRNGKFKYIRNFQPFNIDALMNEYRYRQMAYAEWHALYENGKLNKEQSRFFEPKLPEELYNLEEDPYEMNNLAGNQAHESTLKRMRHNLISWMKTLPDLSLYPEFFLLENAIQDPLTFGQNHKSDIETYIEISNLSLLTFSKAKSKLKKYLNAKDRWKRYWALIVCSSVGHQAKEFTPEIKLIMESDPELINRVRAAEFLGLTGIQNTSKVMSEALYQSKYETEALLILNSIVLQKDYYQKYHFDIDLSRIDKEVRENKLVMERLNYLNPKNAN
ncbi:MAG: sulfatase, partial [Lutimonas sp.]